MYGGGRDNKTRKGRGRKNVSLCLPCNPQGKLNDIPLLSPSHRRISLYTTYHLIESICVIYLIIYKKKTRLQTTNSLQGTIPSDLLASRSILYWPKDRKDRKDDDDDNESDKLNLDLISTSPQPFEPNPLMSINLWKSGGGYSRGCFGQRTVQRTFRM